MGGFPARQMGQRKMQISGWSGSKFSANQHCNVLSLHQLSPTENPNLYHCSVVWQISRLETLLNSASQEHR
jgi:hypothetical protein